METKDWTLIESGYDYVTMTAKTSEDIMLLKNWADTAMLKIHLQGNEIKPSSPMGYVGWQVGAVFGGSRHDGYMLRVSGAGAAEAFLACYSGSVRVTRLDIQVTLRCSVDYDRYAEDLAQATFSNRKTLTGKNWPKLNLHNAFGEGDTLKVGKRHCRRYGRIYNKWMETGEEYYRNCWRFEVEYKRQMATIYADALRGCNDLREIGVRTFDQLSGWGVPYPICSMASNGEPLAGPKKETDADRKLRWIKKQVTPTIGWLREMGYEGELADLIAGWYTDDVQN
jgi:DNA relaxase NicK